MDRHDYHKAKRYNILESKYLKLPTPYGVLNLEKSIL